MNGITLLGHVSAEFERKRKNNVRNIVHKDSVASWGPKPDSATYKAKPRNTRSKYLFGDNLKQVAKDAKRSDVITNKDSYRKGFKVQSKHYASTNQKLVKTSIKQSTKQGQHYNNNRHNIARKFRN